MRKIFIISFLFCSILSAYGDDAFVSPNEVPKSYVSSPSLSTTAGIDEKISNNFREIDRLLTSIDNRISSIRLTIDKIDFIIKNKDDLMLCAVLENTVKDISIVSKKIDDMKNQKDAKSQEDVIKYEDQLKADNIILVDQKEKIKRKGVTCSGR
jgi:hypothetical protein